jgi:hypothetical protein
MKAALLTASIVRREGIMFCKGPERNQNKPALTEGLDSGFCFHSND